MFDKASNSSFPPKIAWLTRVSFRLCEVTLRLSILVLLAVYNGAFFLFLVLCFDLFANYCLYNQELLGEEAVNVFAHVFVTTNLGAMVRNSKQNSNKNKWWNKICLILFKMNGYTLFINFMKHKQHIWGICLIYAKIFQNFCILLVIFLFAITDYGISDNQICETSMICNSYNNRKSMNQATLVVCAFLLAIMTIQIVCVKSMTKHMGLGINLSRNAKVLIRNSKFYDALLMLKVKKNKDKDLKNIDSICHFIIQNHVSLKLNKIETTINKFICHDYKKNRFILNFRKFMFQTPEV